MTVLSYFFLIFPTAFQFEKCRLFVKQTSKRKKHANETVHFASQYCMQQNKLGRRYEKFSERSFCFPLALQCFINVWLNVSPARPSCWFHHIFGLMAGYNLEYMALLASRRWQRRAVPHQTGSAARGWHTTSKRISLIKPSNQVTFYSP